MRYDDEILEAIGVIADAMVEDILSEDWLDPEDWDIVSTTASQEVAQAIDEAIEKRLDLLREEA